MVLWSMEVIHSISTSIVLITIYGHHISLWLVCGYYFKSVPIMSILYKMKGIWTWESRVGCGQISNLHFKDSYFICRIDSTQYMLKKVLRISLLLSIRPNNNQGNRMITRTMPQMSSNAWDDDYRCTLNIWFRVALILVCCVH